jgi:predicted helicase
MHITATQKRAIDQYYRELAGYQTHNVKHETAVRSGFQNLLATFAQAVNWILVPEQPLANGKRPDGTLRDSFNLPRGYWEAKDSGDDLDTEIRKKISIGYPTSNTIFEDTRRAVLYQGNKRVLDADLSQQNELVEVVDRFFHYSEPDIENFERAVEEFKESIPDLAQGLLKIITEEHTRNKAFVAAFSAFLEQCRSSLDPGMSSATVDEMLVQHLLTERLFRTVFDNSDFISRNVIAAEIEKVIQALTSRAFNRREFLKSLDRFYLAIENAARGLDDWTEKQHFLNTVYERFFQGFSVKQADTHGIVYTPQEIVDFMVASVDDLLQREFHSSLSQPGVQILDPCVGTGNFIVNLIQRISGGTLRQKYANDLFCNEIMLLPYYIASLNIEHAYYERSGEYRPFEGICFADTLNLEAQQMELFSERNTERIQRERDAQIMVVIGNPPYNVGQKSENENNKNRRYPMIDERVYEMYVKGSKATNTRALSDAYVKFFRWATDRLQGRDGIVCFVSNNSFVEQVAFDEMRRRLLQEFTQIYHLDLHGNVRKNPKLSGTAHNVFGIQVGVGITIAIRSSNHTERKLFYYRVPESWRRTEKLSFLSQKGDLKKIEWMELHLDEKNLWLTEGLSPEFASFLPMGTKEIKAASAVAVSGTERAIFKVYSRGAETTRDRWMYSFDMQQLTTKASNMIETYNSELARWIRAGSPKDVDSFVLADETKIKWSSRLKECLLRKMEARFMPSAIRHALYRPFTHQFLYFDSIMTHRQGMFPLIFPTPSTEEENVVICLTDVGSEKPFMVMASNIIPDLHLVGAGASTECFPYYTYSEDGSNQRENITDWALAQFQARYGEQVSKWDIFHYVYAMLHHPQYRERYAENLKRELPRIPLLKDRSAFETCVRVGKQLMELHLNYEQAAEYPLTWHENRDVPVNWRVEKMRLTPNKDAVVVNEWLTLSGIPPQTFQYRLGNRSALEWVLDQYQVSTDARSGITSDPNREDDPEYIVRLVGKVVAVSVETVRLVEELAGAIIQEDWLNQAIEEEAIR